MMVNKLAVLIAAVGCVCSGLAVAQSMPNFDPSKMPSAADMQKMMQKAQEMQQCMAKIDTAALEQLESRGEEVRRELGGLCESGQEDDALALAIDFSRELASTPAVQQAQACAEGLPEMLAAMPFEQMAEQYAATDDDAPEDFCDSIR